MILYLNSAFQVKKNLRILYIISGLRFGGAEKLLLLTCKYLIRYQNVYLKVVYLDPHAPLRASFEEMSIDTIYIKRNIFSIFRLASIIHRGHFNIVHTHLIHADFYGRAAALLMACFRKIALFTTVHDVGKYRWQKGMYFSIIRFVDRVLSIPKRAKVIAISESVKKVLMEYEKIKSEKIILLYNAIEIPPKGIEREKGKNDSLRILYVGRLVEDKNVACFLRACSLIKDLPFVLTIVGEGELKEDLQRLATEGGIADRVLFENPTREISHYYRENDVFVMPSKLEGLGIAILEAFAHRLPVIGANVHGIAELLDDERGLVFESDNHHELAELLRWVFHNRRKFQNYIQRAYSYVQKFHDIRKYVAKLREYYLLSQ